MDHACDKNYHALVSKVYFCVGCADGTLDLYVILSRAPHGSTWRENEIDSKQTDTTNDASAYNAYMSL